MGYINLQAQGYSQVHAKWYTAWRSDCKTCCFSSGFYDLKIFCLQKNRQSRRPTGTTKMSLAAP